MAEKETYYQETDCGNGVWSIMGTGEAHIHGQTVSRFLAMHPELKITCAFLSEKAFDFAAPHRITVIAEKR